MEICKLSSLLEQGTQIKSGMVVSHTLNRDMVVYGFISAYKNDGFIVFDNDLVAMDEFHVCCNVLTTTRYTEYGFGKDLKREFFTYPIFERVSVCKETQDLFLNQIYVPELAATNRSQYNKIRSYKNTSFNNKFSRPGIIVHAPDNPKAYIYHTTPGEFLFQDEYNSIRGVGNELMVICRQTNQITGKMDFAMFRPSELFVDKTTSPL
jgi:hypothetical protein